MKNDVRERFLKDVSNHTMDIKHDDGLYRHLVFSNGGSFNYRFEIITYPQYLVICGDVGDYIFSRVGDMFTFFRSETLAINVGYWAEKCQCNNKDREVLKEWSDDLFRENVYRSLEYLFEFSDDVEDLRERVEEEILSQKDFEHEYIRGAMEFEVDGDYPLQDFWEYDCYEYNFHFMWCLYAIVWGIQQYDTIKKGEQHVY